MFRLHQVTAFLTASLLGASLLAAAATISPSGRRLTDESLNGMLGGQIVYCAIPIDAGPGCNACHYIRNCPAIAPNGMPTSYPTYCECTNTSYQVLCATANFGSSPTTPTCNKDSRDVYCGTLTMYSGDQCQNLTNSTADLCGNVIDYTCPDNYSASSSGPNAHGVNCSGISPGYY